MPSSSSRVDVLALGFAKNKGFFEAMEYLIVKVSRR
jgi:hypothetical protein